MVPQKVHEALKVITDYVGKEENKHKIYLKDLFEQAKFLKSEWIFWNAEAMMHVNFKIKPTTKRLGYALANGRCTERLSKAKKELLSKIEKEFDMDDYVFSCTHYDEKSNGYYFRRS